MSAPKGFEPLNPFGVIEHPRSFAKSEKVLFPNYIRQQQCN